MDNDRPVDVGATTSFLHITRQQQRMRWPKTRIAFPLFAQTRKLFTTSSELHLKCKYGQ